MTLVTALMVALLIYQYVPFYVLFLWWGTISGLAGFYLVRWLLYKRRRKSQVARQVSSNVPTDFGSTIVRACIVSALSGALWGGAVVFLPNLPSTLIPVMVIAAGAMAGGAATTLGALPLAAHLYVLFAILPYSAYFLFLDGRLDHIGLGALAAFMAVGLVWATRLVYGAIIKELGLRDRNSALIDTFRRERDEWRDLAFAAEAYAVFDPKQRLQAWNGRFATLFELSDAILQVGTSRRDVVSALTPPVGIVVGTEAHRSWIEAQLTLETESGGVREIAQMMNGRWVQSFAHRSRSGSTVMVYVDQTETKLAQQKSEVLSLRLVALAKATSDVFWEIGPDGIVNQVQGPEEGAPRSSFIGKPFADVWGDERAIFESAESLITIVEQKRPVSDFEYRMKLKSESQWYYLRASGVPVYDSEDRYLGYFLAIRNVTEGKTLELENQQRSQEITQLTENLSAGVFRMRRQDSTWEIEYANSWLTSEYGIEQNVVEALIAGFETELMSPDQADERRETIKAYAVTNQSYECRWMLSLPDGRVRWILERGRFLSGADGESGIEGLLWDITQTVDYEQALLKGQKRLSEVLAVLDSATEAIAIQSETGEIAYSNKAARALIGKPKASPAMGGFVSFLPLGDREKSELVKDLEDALAVYGTWEKTVPVALDEGGTSVYEMRIDSIQKGGAIFVATDVTLRKQSEIEEQTLRAELAESKQLQEVGQLAGGIAHDFANIISAVRSFADILMEDLEENTSERGYASKIAKACDRATNMVNQILLFAKTSRLEKEPVSVDHVWGQITGLLSGHFDGFTSLSTSSEITDEVVECSEAGLLQVALNLAVNARDAFEGEAGTVRISARPVAFSTSDLADYVEGRHRVDGSAFENEYPMHRVIEGRLEENIPYVCICVEDDGVGIGFQDLAQILDPFFTTKGASKGTGLGLSVVRNVVARSQGTLIIESTVGKGSQFSAYLPASDKQPAAPVASIEQSPPPVITTPLNRTARILIVDDEEDLSDVFSTALTKVGYETTNTYSAVEAWEVFKDDPDAWDAIVTDQVMPKMRGTELIERVREIRSDIPIILCTAFSETLSKTSALDLGASVFMSKPVAITDLISTVDTLLANTNTVH